MLKQRARLLKADALALYYAARHPATPWYAKFAQTRSKAGHQVTKNTKLHQAGHNPEDG